MPRPLRYFLLAMPILSAVFAIAQTRPADPLRSPAATFSRAIKQLTDEARLSIADQKLVRQSADFAKQSLVALPPDFVGQKLLRPQHADPFLDAYIRWQLTSFEPKLSPKLADRQFDQMLADLPPMIRNPRADQKLINSLQTASRAGALDPQQISRINQELNSLADRSSRAAELNQPALGLRKWLLAQLPKTGKRALMSELERCAALIDAGWPADDAKTSLDELFKSSNRDRECTADDRKSVIERLDKLKGKKNLYVTNASVRDNTVYAEYADTGIYDFDVTRWTKLLNQ